MIETNVEMTILKVSVDNKILATCVDGELLTAKSVHKPSNDDVQWQEFESIEHAKEFYGIQDFEELETEEIEE